MRKAAAVTRSKIIQVLASGDFHSGEDLGELTGISRSAVANHIKYLSDIGLDIFSVKGRGYRLANPIKLLDKAKILSYMGDGYQQNIDVFTIIDSTNTYIKQNLEALPQGYMCLAEAQTSGRGRRGKTWISPLGSSIYMSLAWTFSGGYQSMVGLSLLVGIGINRVMQKLGIDDCKLKWPNDVYHNNKKLAGILIEVEGQVGSDANSIIGIGINVELPKNISGIDQPFTDIKEILNQSLDRNELIAMLFSTLIDMLKQFERSGLKPFLEEWKKADLFYNQYVYLVSGNNNIHGVSKGINESGALLLENSGGITPHHGGEISVRKL